MSRKGVVPALGGLVLAVVAGALFVTSALGTPGPPVSIAALGSAISAGVCTDRSCAARTQNSWSTGTNPAVGSQRLRLGALDRGIRGPGSERFHTRIRAYTFATSAFNSVADLEAQARKAVTRPWRYATVELGVGDLCGRTSIATFRTRLQRSLSLLVKPAPFEVGGLGPGVGREVLVLSIEDLISHWQVVRANAGLARFLSAGHTLDCGLGYDVSAERLTQIRSRAVALNDVIARLCFRLGCLYDAGLHYRMRPAASYFSPANPRYLSIAGQHALAALEWKPALALISAGS